MALGPTTPSTPRQHHHQRGGVGQERPARGHTAANQSVNEDVRTLLTGISYTDPDAFGSTSNTITLTVGTGRLYFHATSNSVTGGAPGCAGAVGSDTVTLQGTKTQLDTASTNLRYRGAANY